MTLSSIESVKNKYFLERLHEHIKKEFSEENFLFVYDKSNNQVLYEKYIKVGAPREVNISGAQRSALIALAAAKKWTAMSAPMLVARKEVIKLINSDSLPRFLASDDGKLASFMLAVGADGPKATNLAGLLKVYERPRTPEDKQAAYAAMLKLANMSLLNPALRALGLEPPARVMPKKGDPAKALKLMGVPSKLVPQMTKLIGDYAKATTPSARATALAQMDKIAKDVVKHDAIVAALKSSGLT